MPGDGCGPERCDPIRGISVDSPAQYWSNRDIRCWVLNQAVRKHQPRAEVIKGRIAGAVVCRKILNGEPWTWEACSLYVEGKHPGNKAYPVEATDVSVYVSSRLS